MKNHYNNLYLGIGTSFLFGFVSLWVIPNFIVVPLSVQMTGVSPIFWPEVVSWSLVGLGLILAGSSFLQLLRAGSQGVRIVEGGGESGAVPKIAPVAIVKTFLTIGAMAGYYFLVDYLGMLSSSMLALFAFTLIYGEYRLKLTVPLSILVPLILYFFFVKVANIPMPQGLFGW